MQISEDNTGYSIVHRTVVMGMNPGVPRIWKTRYDHGLVHGIVPFGGIKFCARALLIFVSRVAPPPSPVV